MWFSPTRPGFKSRHGKLFCFQIFGKAPEVSISHLFVENNFCQNLEKSLLATNGVCSGVKSRKNSGLGSSVFFFHQKHGDSNGGNTGFQGGFAQSHPFFLLEKKKSVFWATWRKRRFRHVDTVYITCDSSDF